MIESDIIRLIITIAVNTFVIGVGVGIMRSHLKALPKLLKAEMELHVDKELQKLEDKIEIRIRPIEKQVDKHEIILQAEEAETS